MNQECDKNKIFTRPNIEIEVNFSLYIFQWQKQALNQHKILISSDTSTLTCSHVSVMVRGPCSFKTSNITLVIVCVCSGGVLSSIGFIFGFGFLAIYLTAVANMMNLFHSQNPTQSVGGNTLISYRHTHINTIMAKKLVLKPTQV